MIQQKFPRVGLLLRFSKGKIHYFVIAFIASMFGTVFDFLTPQVIRITVDSVIGDKPFSLPAFFAEKVDLNAVRELFRTNLLWCAGFILLFSILSGLCTYIRITINAKGAEGMIRRVRDALYSHIQKLPFRWHVRHQTGDIIQRCTMDVELIRNFIANQFLDIIRTIFLIVFALSIMFTMNVKMSLTALVFIPIIIAYSGIFYAKIGKKFKVADEAEGELSAGVQENLTGVRVVRAFGREKYEIDRFDEKNNRFSNLWMKLGYVLGSYWGIGDLITGLQILTIIALGTVETVHGNITLGEFLVFISYNTTLIWPIRGLGRILSEMSKTGVSLSRINYIFQAEEERDNPDDITPPLTEDIVFEHVSYTYEGAKPVLKNIDFTIRKGSTFAILGGTGSGKSTLMHLLNRLYDLPDGCGRITIGGVDIRHIRRDWLRGNIGMVLQEPFLFSKTIRENIAVCCPEASEEDIRRMARVACVDRSILNFANGYDTIVGERGVTLSGGQKQRVAIARMLMQKAPIMIFDDSLSAVDTETDSQIRRALQDNLGDSTVILISHRITTLMQADQILVMENGQIEEMGTHEQLLKQDGIYKKIYDIQMNQQDKLLTEKEGV